MRLCRVEKGSTKMLRKFVEVADVWSEADISRHSKDSFPEAHTATLGL